MEIKILGPGCQKCKTLEKITRDVISEMGISAEITKEEEIMNIVSCGIMNTPGFVIKGKVVFSGHFPTSKELRLSTAFNNRSNFVRALPPGYVRDCNRDSRDYPGMGTYVHSIGGRVGI
jgi:small redox-active disulfide protein 2